MILFLFVKSSRQLRAHYVIFQFILSKEHYLRRYADRLLEHMFGIK